VSDEPLAGVVMGSASDLEVMRPAIDALDEFGLAAEVRVLSAHRTPDDTLAWARDADRNGLRVLIAGAGAAAALPGTLAAVTSLPVIGVPIAATPLNGIDALLAIAQMPGGVPVACVAVDGARNAGLLAVRILAAGDDILRRRYDAYRERMAEEVRAKDHRVRSEFDRRQGGKAPLGFG
jgi:5-(carboxyamino)imidazole ribonucleotide mutase